MQAFANSAKQQAGMFKSSLKTAMKQSVIDVQSTSKKAGYVPVKKGDLRRSITHEVTVMADSVIGRVGSNKVYAAIQEFGGDTGRNKSVHIQGKFYLTRAVKDNEDKMKERFKKLVAIKRR